MDYASVLVFQVSTVTDSIYVNSIQGIDIAYMQENLNTLSYKLTQLAMYVAIQVRPG